MLWPNDDRIEITASHIVANLASAPYVSNLSYKKGGYAGTGMCGPCCTGEADTIGEITE